LLGEPAKLPGQSIRLRHPGITQNLKIAPIVTLKQGKQIPPYHMVSKVR
jgi:hypothetical protein